MSNDRIKNISILGATGSIGTQALDIIRMYPDRFRAKVLTAKGNAQVLFKLVREFKPDVAALEVKPEQIPEDLKSVEWFFGEDALLRAAQTTGVHDVLAAVVGVAGLPAVLEALDVADRVLLANKEALVTGGQLVMDKARRLGKPIIPVDSEHSAIFQCLQGANGNLLNRIILTASGGPFRTWDKARIDGATVEQALGHPTWKMGPKITVDCASMMNKGLEVIEAKWLFDLPLEKINVVVHPQSVVHSMVEYKDGAVMAQMGTPDMRGPIGYALGYPERIDYQGERLDFGTLSGLIFENPDTDKFPCLTYAYKAQEQGGIYPTALNGANEEAVQSFLEGRIWFGDIARVNRYVLDNVVQAGQRSLEDVYEADRQGRVLARSYIEKTR